MPTYDYYCPKCETYCEIIHSMKDESERQCESCSTKLERAVSWQGTIIASGIKPTIDDYKESEHKKKVKDPERAVKMRKKAFGTEAVGNPSMKSDPKHIVKRGRTLQGQQTEVDKKEFIKAAAKDDRMVQEAKKVLKKSS